jgi:phosphoglycerol transferase MdoB-like AlkP superfamily enzyme
MIHNYDHAFGEFWTYFKNSPYYKNTILILTADHSHYSAKPYVEAVNRDPEYQGIFVDRIPLIIHDPTHNLPSSYDANYATSIDFAPSLIHLLELPNSKNAFFGTSIFSSDRKTYDGLGLVSISDDNYIVDNEKIHWGDNSTSRREALRLADRLMRFFKKTEMDNKLWNAEWDEQDQDSAANEIYPTVFER